MKRRDRLVDPAASIKLSHKEFWLKVKEVKGFTVSRDSEWQLALDSKMWELGLLGLGGLKQKQPGLEPSASGFWINPPPPPPRPKPPKP